MEEFMKVKAPVIVLILIVICTAGIIFWTQLSQSWPKSVLKGHWRSDSNTDVYFSKSGVWTVNDSKTELLKYDILRVDKDKLTFELNVLIPPFSNNLASLVKLSRDGKEMEITTYSGTPYTEGYTKIDDRTAPPSDKQVNALRGGFAQIQYYAQEGNLDKIRELIENGADINLQDRLGFTALHASCKNGQIEVVRYLLEHGANPNIQSYAAMMSPLDSSIMEGDQYPKIVSLLIRHGANVKIRAADGDTPLHGAAFSNSLSEIVRLLLEAGADPQALNNSGKSPIDIANEQGQNEIVTILKGALNTESP
jgi:hypothetical protein